MATTIEPPAPRVAKPSPITTSVKNYINDKDTNAKATASKSSDLNILQTQYQSPIDKTSSIGQKPNDNMADIQKDKTPADMKKQKAGKSKPKAKKKSTTFNDCEHQGDHNSLNNDKVEEIKHNNQSTNPSFCCQGSINVLQASILKLEQQLAHQMNVLDIVLESKSPTEQSITSLLKKKIDPIENMIKTLDKNLLTLHEIIEVQNDNLTKLSDKCDSLTTKDETAQLHRGISEHKEIHISHRNQLVELKSNQVDIR